MINKIIFDITVGPLGLCSTDFYSTYFQLHLVHTSSVTITKNIVAQRDFNGLGVAY